MDADRGRGCADDRPGETRTSVVVVGGGIAGLVAARTARSRGASVVVLEPHPLGGRARTDRRGGFTFNRGPRALYQRGVAEARLGELGVDVASGGRPVVGGALAITADGAHRLPVGPIASVATSLFRPREKLGAARHLLPLLRDPGPIAPDRTLSSWLDERGTTGRVRGFLEAMVRVATYVDAPDEVAAIDALAQARRAATSGVRYLDGGFGSIVASLAAGADADGIEIRPVAARALARRDGRWRIETTGGPVDADAVVLAAGGPATATRLIGDAPPSWSRLGPPARAACLELGVRRPPEHRFALGIDRPTYLSVHAPPADLAPDGQAVVHVMRYRRATDDLAPEASRAELLDVARLAGIDPDDIVEQRYLDAMEVTGAIPVAANGGVAGRPTVAVAHRPGLFVAGDWVGPEGQLLDAAVASAHAAGQQAAAAAGTMAMA
ncbi:MAG: FAD-dependent oxidoreductase [Acidimicrobiales bacterium]